MSLPFPAAGHADLRERFRTAAREGRLPQSLLLYGPEGVGKQTLGLWTAALLQCEEADPPCGACRSCRLLARLEHPDVHWHMPLPRPKGASTPEKLREKLEEARLEEIARRRASPLEPREADGPTGIYLAAVEEIRAQASRRPAMGRRAVFVVGDAEQMVPQAANPEAANAFLKLLEEPPPYAHVLLTSSRPGALLPTIRSRTLAVRVPPLRQEEVAAFLERHAGADADEAARAGRLAQGSVGRALRILAGLEGEEREAALDLLRAALSPRDGDRFQAAATLSNRGARGAFTEILARVDELLRDLLSLAAGNPEAAFDADALAPLIRRGLPAPEAVARAADHVEEARAAAAGNANPQATAAVLLFDLHGTLRA